MSIDKETKDPVAEILGASTKTQEDTVVAEEPEETAKETPPETKAEDKKEEVKDDVTTEDKKSETTEKTTEETKTEETKEDKKEEVTDAETKEQKEQKDKPSLVEDWLENKAGEKASGYEDIGKALNIHNTDKDSVLSAINNLKEENSSLKKSTETIFANDVIKEANELARQGGDWLDYLGITSRDYSQYSDRELLAADYRNRFKDDPKFNVEEYLDSLTEDEVKVKGSDIRQSLTNNQSFKKEDLQTKANQKKKDIDDGIKNALSKIDDIDGFKLNEAIKERLFNGLTTNSIFTDMFYGDDKKMDFNKMIRSAFILQHFNNIVNYYKTSNRNEGKKSVMKKLTNQQIDAKPVTEKIAQEPDALTTYIHDMRGEGKSSKK